MATKVTSVPVGNYGNRAFDSGKPWNVYDTYAHALAHGATGFITIYDFDHIAGTANVASIAQVAKQVGVLPGQDGRLVFGVDNGADIYIARYVNVNTGDCVTKQFWETEWGYDVDEVKYWMPIAVPPGEEC